MRIKRKFVRLTKRTIPYGTEYLLEKHLPEGYQIDEHGNYYFVIGESETMFTCHMDTAGKTSSPVKVNHTFNGNLIGTDRTSILGADDKAGMVVLLYMIEHNIPGVYYFFIGEECGCIGSRELSYFMPSRLSHIKRIISFDRCDVNSVITSQMGGMCCSDEFADALCHQFNTIEKTFRYVKDPTGIYTDSAEFMDIIPECTNISVGYDAEHTNYETQDIDHLVKLCKACLKVDWESLPTVREPGDNGYSKYVPNWESSNKKYENNFPQNYIWINYDGNGSKKAYISDERIRYEKELIASYLQEDGITYKQVTWDGNYCWIRTQEGQVYVGSRNELSDYIMELIEIPKEHLIYERDLLVT